MTTKGRELIIAILRTIAALGSETTLAERPESVAAVCDDQNFSCICHEEMAHEGPHHCGNDNFTVTGSPCGGEWDHDEDGEVVVVTMPEWSGLFIKLFDD